MIRDAEIVRDADIVLDQVSPDPRSEAVFATDQMQLGLLIRVVKYTNQRYHVTDQGGYVP